jgi:hypothetical protein
MTSTKDWKSKKFATAETAPNVAPPITGSVRKRSTKKPEAKTAPLPSDKPVAIGDTVSYIRQNKDGIFEGIAKFKGMGLDGEGRVVSLLKAGEDSFNAFYACLNRDQAFHDQFRAAMAQVNDIAAEGNAKVKEVVEAYNARTGAIYDELVGKIVEL